MDTDRTHKVLTERTAGIQFVGEERTESGIEEESLQPQLNPPIDPRLTQTDHNFLSIHTSEDYPPLPEQTVEVPGEEFGMQDDNAWLDNMFINNDDDWMLGREQTQSSPLTSPPASLAEEPLARTGNIFKGCNCTAHQHIYNDWPSSPKKHRYNKFWLTPPGPWSRDTFWGSFGTQGSPLFIHLCSYTFPLVRAYATAPLGAAGR